MQESTAKVRALPAIATLRNIPPAAFGDTLRIAGATYPNAAALIESATVHDAVMLYASDRRQAQEWLTQLRRSRTYALAPIFVPQSIEPALDMLTDGVAGAPTHIYERIRAIQDRAAVLPARQPLDEEERFLAYLYTRPDVQVQPICDWQLASVYRYPLLDVFTPVSFTAEQWLMALRRRGLLESIQLVDRVRQCPSCTSAHLNFIDVCPQCSCIDIAESMFLHCHTCGHVDKQATFVSSAGLSCPKCMARLRHIGVDYDRALEAFSCAGCNGRFTEPEVEVHCLQCREGSRTEHLIERRIESYRLSEAGQLAARTGRIGDLFALIDDSNCVHPAYFEQTLDFLIALARRHSEVEFGVVCLRWGNVRELLADLPRVQVSQLVDGFALRLRELVRTTDLVMRSDDEHCWLLLPQTPREGVQTLLARVEHIPQAAQSPSGRQLSLVSAAACSADLAQRQIDAKLLMAELRSRID